MSSRIEAGTPPPPRGDKRLVRQSANRASYEREDLYHVLDACPIGHVSFVHEGWPQSVPTAIARIEDHLYLHGHPKSRLYLALSRRERVCVSACRVDGLVKARSAFHCSMNYRSAVVFGAGELVAAEQKAALLDRFTERLIPGSLDDYRPYLAKELKGTALIRLALDEYSVKIRTGDPIDDAEDLDLPHWAGVIPIESTYGTPRPSANLNTAVNLPDTLLAGVDP
ncbi:pyridoxamine 5'-phosphate oxidase family protein [Granulosicoccus sp. 3-233]|uniref:pyridoxamine 5'-phosphate oxidase family protein n=1 Tax=Granulosicoccus sp. 3-233 TaxID=3417969 RepID=UPI003D32507E